MPQDVTPIPSVLLLADSAVAIALKQTARSLQACFVRKGHPLQAAEVAVAKAQACCERVPQQGLRHKGRLQACTVVRYGCFVSLQHASAVQCRPEPDDCLHMQLDTVLPDLTCMQLHPLHPSALTSLPLAARKPQYRPSLPS